MPFGILKTLELGNLIPPRSFQPLQCFDVFLKTLQCLKVFDIIPRDFPKSPEMLERAERFVTI